MNLKNKLFSLTVLFMMIVFESCSFIASLEEPSSDNINIEENSIKITSLSMSKSSLETQVGAMEYLSVTVKPVSLQKNIHLYWNYDRSIIECDTSSAWGVTIKGIAEGQTNLRCSCEGIDYSCLVTVKGYADNYEITTEPYIYSNYSILQTSPGISEKVFVSLYGGDASDIDGYTWTVDNPSVAAIQPSGQYCMISAKDTGYARIKITHNKAAYPYYMGIYVFDDATKVSYITTSSNIVTMNMEDGEQNISVSLVNGKETSLDSQFSWEIINDEGSGTPLELSWNGNNAVISPKQSGSCTLRITHPDAVYPLDILCRVISIVKNVYIQPDSTVITLSGSAEQTVTSTLKNLDDGEYNIDGYKYVLDDYSVAQIVSSIGNQVTLRGVANGSCKLIISHEKAAYSREVLVISNNQIKDAVDASCYITTSQNYIRTKAGDESQTISVSLKGGSEGDESDFHWNVESKAADGSASKVIDFETVTGTVFHTYSRSAAPVYTYGSAVMQPLCEGTAVITVTHPKVAYPTEILVKVLNKDAVLEEQLYFSGSGLMKILNGDSKEYTVELKGSSKTSSDDNDISWQCDTDYLTVSASANVANIKAPPLETGSTISYITISHPKAEADKRLLVMTADDEETLNSMKALYSDKTYYNIENGSSASCYVYTAGFADDYDFSPLSWSIKDPSVITVEKSSFNPLSCKITGLKSGSTTLTASIDDVKCDFDITVYPKGCLSVSKEIYFTTSKNVITLDGAGKRAEITISAVNLASSEYQNIEWTSSNESVAEIIGNGTSATVTAAGEGESVISIYHKDSQNTLKIYVRVGSEYIIPDAEPVTYISSADVMTFLKDGEIQTLQAVLVNYDGTDTSGFYFTIDNPLIAEITAQSKTGIAYIKPLAAGQAEITITHPATDISKKVLVVVGNSMEELSGYVYLTTSSNVVAVGEGNTKTVSVSVKNAQETIVDGYTWLSSNQNVISIQDTGASAVLTGNGIGTALITVTNKACQYPLTIIAQCVDPLAAASNPYIQLSSSVMTLNVGSSYASVTADLVGGTTEDYQDFVWSVKDSSVCAVYGQNEVGKIRALSAGQTYITVRHPKAGYSAQLLVVCDEVKESECYITVPSSIISVKPNASTQTITATLVNGTTTDKYNFSWSLDVYDIIDFQYSANVCTITPKQTGTATITISHPKAAYSQQIIVNVQEYSEFSFPQTSVSLTQGTVSFQNMEVPATSVTTHIEYSVDNASICSISGTKAVAQITGIAPGTTTVRAKLVASSTGVTQAESEMLVYVKEAETNKIYITSSSTIYTVNKGKSQTLSATLSGTGITAADQYNLKWTTSDTDVISITGITSDGTVTGQSIYITANKPGEALITCSHEKAASDLQFYVVVPGSAEKIISLSKSYMTLTKGSSGSTLKANIENAESSSDYYNIEWTAQSVNGNEIVRIMGNGQSVTIYPIATGETTVTAQLPDSEKTAKCTVIVEAGKSLSFETSSKKVQPFHSRTVKYTVSPPDAVMSWTVSQEDDYFEYHDLGCDENGIGYVEITGIKEGTGTLACVTDGSAKAKCTVKVSWDYEFTVDTTRISGSPDASYNISYTVNPADAVISIEGNGLCDFNQKTDGEGKGTITVIPHSEGTDTIILKATNPNMNDEEIGNYSINGSFYYEKLTVSCKLQKDVSAAAPLQNAYWSRFENDAIFLGDGEQLSFMLSIDETKADDLNITAALQKKSNPNISVSTSGTNGQFVLTHNSDIKTAAYRITAGFRPTYKGSTCYPDGSPINIGDFVSNLSQSEQRYENWVNPFHFDYHYNRCGTYIVSNLPTMTCTVMYDTGYMHEGYRSITVADRSYINGDWGIVRDESLDGKWIPASEFQSYVWYFMPAFSLVMGGDCISTFVHAGGEIDTSHILADYYSETQDTTLVSSTQVDTLVVTITHSGKKQVLYFPVYLEVRYCACTLK